MSGAMFFFMCNIVVWCKYMVFEWVVVCFLKFLCFFTDKKIGQVVCACPCMWRVSVVGVLRFEVVDEFVLDIGRREFVAGEGHFE